MCDRSERRSVTKIKKEEGGKRRTPCEVCELHNEPCEVMETVSPVI